MSFDQSYLGRLRALVGTRLLLVPGARIVIERSDGKILLQHRSDFQLWGLPGGTAEEGESIEETIVREVLEETGLTVKHVTPFAHASEPENESITFPNGDRCHFHVMNFWSRDFAGDPRGSEEGFDLQWFDLGALPSMLPNMRRSVDAFRRFQATGAFQLI
jgi:8-oxo-dGTP pyrophosphatase MutT (NUDIX family)